MSGSLESTWPFASCGSTAMYVGVPSVVDVVRSNLPSVVVARYGAIGSPSCHVQVALPPACFSETSTPFANTVRPSGTLMRKSNAALSRGLSFAGYQPGEPCGSLTTKAPSSVGTQPSIDVSGSDTTLGCPA